MVSQSRWQRTTVSQGTSYTKADDIDDSNPLGLHLQSTATEECVMWFRLATWGDSPFSNLGWFSFAEPRRKKKRIQTSRSVSSLLESQVLYRLPSSGFLKAFNVAEMRRRFFLQRRPVVLKYIFPVWAVFTVSSASTFMCCIDFKEKRGP